MFGIRRRRVQQRRSEQSYARSLASSSSSLHSPEASSLSSNSSQSHLTSPSTSTIDISASASSELIPSTPSLSSDCSSLRSDDRWTRPQTPTSLATFDDAMSIASTITKSRRSLPTLMEGHEHGDFEYVSFIDFS